MWFTPVSKYQQCGCFGVEIDYVGDVYAGGAQYFGALSADG